MRPANPLRAAVRPALLALIVTLLAPGVALGATPPPLPRDGTDVAARNSWIVTLKPRADAKAEARGLAKAAGGRVGLVYTHALNGFQLRGSARAAAALRRNPRVVSVQADQPVYLTETAPYGVSRIGAFIVGGGDAYAAGYRGSGARIAVIDTGIDLDHPDLAASIDAASGENCANPAVAPDDGHGHGTHVSGTAAAPLNGEGVVGVAPEAELIPIKAFDDVGNSSEAWVLCGLDRVVALNTDGDAANDIDVVNMSWGETRAWGSCADDPLHGAICAADATGAVLVAGAGNDAGDAGNFVPAAYPEVISVSALADLDGKPGALAGCQFIASLFWFECDDSLAFFSNFGASVDVAAPGVNVYSTWAGGGYSTQAGTSMATPHVAGVAALMRSLDHALTTSQVRAVIQESGECPNGEVADADAAPGCAGQGTWPDDPDGIPEVVVNALRAAQVVDTGAPPPPPPPPPPPEPTAPAAPSLTSATPGTDRITLAWTAPSDDGGSPITGYEIWRGTSAGGESLLASVGIQLQYADLAVSAGTTYWYQVAAVNDVGTGPLSNERQAELVTAASAPTLLGAPADGQAVLSWTVPTDDGGSPITGYHVYRSVAGGPEGLLGTAGASETVWIDSGLTNGTEYTYRVAAVTAAGEGALSNPVTVVPTGSATAPSAPQDLAASKAKGNVSAIELSWSPPASDGGSPIATYFVYRQGPSDADFAIVATLDGGTLAWTDTAVEKRATYAYYVTAWNAYGASPPSNEVSIRSK